MALLLEHEWTAWYDHPTPGRTAKDYEKGLHTLCNIKTVQDFWGCFNNLPSISTLENKCGFHFMRTGVKPAWEDSENSNGGIWKIKLGKTEAEETWKELLMSIIGDSYKDVIGVEVNGVSVSYKQGEYFATVWFRDECKNLDVKGYLNGLMPVEKSFDVNYLSVRTLVNNLA